MSILELIVMSHQTDQDSLQLDLQDVQFVSRYGGNIRVFMSNVEVKEKSLTSPPDESNFLKDFERTNFHIQD